MSDQLYKVIKRPVITEKSTTLQEQNKYVFDILPAANHLNRQRFDDVAFLRRDETELLHVSDFERCQHVLHRCEIHDERRVGAFVA